MGIFLTLPQVLSDLASSLIYFLKSIFSHCPLKEQKTKKQKKPTKQKTTKQTSIELIFKEETTHFSALSQFFAS